MSSIPKDIVCTPDNKHPMEPQQEQQQESHLRNFFSDEAFNPDAMERLLETEMMQLTTTDRNNIIEEIHGVRCMAPTETPELLERSLLELQLELDKIPMVEKHAFLYASAASSPPPPHSYSIHGSYKQHYVNTDEFRLRFLRCELFDASKAARRLVNYLDLITNTTDAKSMAFHTAPAVLRRPITLADFSVEEQEMMRKGHLQLLPFRDRSGRRVLAGIATLGIRFNPHQWYKIVLYFLWAAGDDLESQQRGIVILLWPDPNITESIKIRFPMNDGHVLAKKVFRCAPLRVAAIHFCAPDNEPFFRVLKSVLAWTLSYHKRSRLRFHSGQPIELKYDVGGYGIPTDLLPLTSTGNVKLNYMKQWMRLRTFLEDGIRAEEKYEINRNWIECPGSRDVIFKPGKPNRFHLGNLGFRSVIEAMSPKHKLASQTQKSEIARTVVDEMIHVRGGRFLVWDSKGDDPQTFPGAWRAIEDPHLQRQKVAISFRNFKTHHKGYGLGRTIMAVPESPPSSTMMMVEPVPSTMMVVESTDCCNASSNYCLPEEDNSPRKRLRRKCKKEK